MSLAVGKYGVEYDPNRGKDDASGLGWVVVVALLAAAVSLIWTIVARCVRRGDEIPEPLPPPPAVETPSAADPPRTPDPVPDPAPIPPKRIADRRSPEVRNLLLRREEAKKKGDVELEVSTIEQIRSLPGQPAADLDDLLARRLGALNVKWLFELGNAKWVKEVVVKSGDFSSRIAAEHGSTLESLRRLNPGVDVDRLRVGRKLRVLSYPNFNLVVRSRPRVADLQLKGKFFKRYDLMSAVACDPGAYETPANLRQFLAEHGISFAPGDLDELAALMPRRSAVTVSEM